MERYNITLDKEERGMVMNVLRLRLAHVERDIHSTIAAMRGRQTTAEERSAMYCNIQRAEAYYKRLTAVAIRINTAEPIKKEERQ